MSGIDCATSFSSSLATLFANSGTTHIGRYLVSTGWKRLTKQEAQIITNAGMKIISVFETSADRPKGGTLAGIADGQTALQCAIDVGQTLGTAIYFAVDYDAQLEDMTAIRDYFNAAKSQITGYKVGVYGSYFVMDAMKDICDHFWQCAAWSKRQRFEGMNLFQSQIDIQMNGIQVDVNEIYENTGAWDSYMISVDDANKVIKFLQAAYGATTDDEAHAEYKRLANELRKASGQPIT